MDELVESFDLKRYSFNKKRSSTFNVQGDTVY